MSFRSFFQVFVFFFFLSSLSVMSYIQNQTEVKLIITMILIDTNYIYLWFIIENSYRVDRSMYTVVYTSKSTSVYFCVYTYVGTGGGSRPTPLKNAQYVRLKRAKCADKESKAQYLRAIRQLISNHLIVGVTRKECDTQSVRVLQG